LLQGGSVSFTGKILLPIKFFLKMCRVVVIPQKAALCAFIFCNCVPSIGREFAINKGGLMIAERNKKITVLIILFAIFLKANLFYLRKGKK